MDPKLLTPMMKQYIETKKKHPEGILLFRAGDFYEMFFDDAKQASTILNITLTKRGKGLTEAPLAGIPYHSIDPYISKLIKAGKKVVICEQIEDPKKAKGLVKRAVTRIITPSTLFDDNYENNFLCSISKLKEIFGFSFIDITTGEFKTTIFYNFNELLNELSSIKPKELIITKNILNNLELINLIKKSTTNTIINYSENLDSSLSSEQLKKHFKLNSLEVFGLNNKPECLVSAYNALKYLKDTQFSELTYINNIKDYTQTKYLKLDRKTIRNLELVSNLNDSSTNNSLFSLINFTKTPMGYRKLYFDILHPILNKKELILINNSVEELINNIFLQQELTQQLSFVGDIERIISKVGFGNASPRDLISLKQSLEVIPKLKECLKDCKTNKLNLINSSLQEINELVKLLEASIVSQPPFSVREGNFINPNYSKELFDLVNIHKSVDSWLIEYEAKLKNETDIKSLKVKFNKIFGYYIEIPKFSVKNIPSDFERKQTLVNAERFTTPKLFEKENLVLNAKDKRYELEYNIFLDVCKEVLKYQKEINALSKVIGNLDVILSHSIVSLNNSYSKPNHTNTSKIDFKELRHPIIEKLVDFIPNDCFLDENNRTMIITGPNMSGKSSYMRSVCLGLILAHIGCFLPCKSSEIGCVDGVFTRVGASDDIIHGQSTFLVEMSEVAYILNNCTKNSFIILDEIGRGTSTYDGLSLAWSIIEYLNNNILAKTLVATHYHQLNKLEENYVGIKNYHVTAKEENNNLFFYHKLREGGIDKSYGIQVAKLSGINKQIIERALLIQRELEEEIFLKKQTLKKKQLF
ncbi:MAG: DNA mismatch repair protein MutS [archaeon]|nr:DNA mismatch repair protein MutS [archaeon]MDD2477773.1 DNA mismatch repair protein MutS [Candidatus ainarchaeum sp.]MDD3084855.1 DNA mismatch repair protein MutS [Candidatus ainarchaeum sp.]MDD4221189.1 DNA mismatch repair protein MutS [Candidatus ainarchaeum sp.]MDD4662859.1 DNA mismatch repair protein MutS [Candidatus ainarchaeum sp.]